MTKTIIIDTDNINIEEITKAAEIIKSGGLVAFPTETVYGLGANALDPIAVAGIFIAKGRPADNPLIIHIADKSSLIEFCENIPEIAYLLFDKFSPGPLTLVLEKSILVPDIVSAGLATVAVRIPDNKIALELIKLSNLPIAAPSANSSGKPSPTLAEHVADDLTGKIDMILDGGATQIGIESTVLDLTHNPPLLLRPGSISKEEIESVIGKIEIAKAVTEAEKVASPGMKYKHYAPKAKVVLFDSIEELEIESYSNCAIIVSEKDNDISYENKKSFSSIEVLSHNLYAWFREFDKLGVEIIFVQNVDSEGKSRGLANRLKKAAGEI